MDKNYVLDDTFQISEEIQNMSEEEMKEQVRIWEEEARREKIKERKTLISAQQKDPKISLSFLKNIILETGGGE